MKKLLIYGATGYTGRMAADYQHPVTVGELSVGLQRHKNTESLKGHFLVIDEAGGLVRRERSCQSGLWTRQTLQV